ncbi:MAG TPA: hypothetical protein DIV86_06695 [Alphaproteobacteria bacterium]|nr:hypothetical protein [Alphaproteobacteria bacterium]
MKNIPENLQTHLTSDATNLVKCLLVKLSNETEIGFTESDIEFEYEGVIYKPFSGFNLDKLNYRLNANQEAQIYTCFDDFEISQADIISGKYLDAEIEIFSVNISNLSSGKIILQTGFVAEIISDKEKFFFKIEGFASKLKKIITQYYSKQCRAKFGDAKCGKDLEDYKYTGSVTESINNYSFKDTSREEEDYYFNYGVIKFLSGQNLGIKYDVRKFRDEVIELLLPSKFSIQTGDEYEIYVGCDKEFSTCISKFNNAINFRGEPSVPGSEKLLRGF